VTVAILFSSIVYNKVCIKCYRHVESVIKLETQKENLKKQIIESWRKVHTLMLTPSSKSTRRVTQKRLLRSPGVSLPPSKEIRPVRPLSRFAPIPIRPGSFRPYSRSPRFINSALN
jgi:hypothetical protein